MTSHLLATRTLPLETITSSPKTMPQSMIRDRRAFVNLYDVGSLKCLGNSRQLAAKIVDLVKFYDDVFTQIPSIVSTFASTITEWLSGEAQVSPQLLAAVTNFVKSVEGLLASVPSVPSTISEIIEESNQHTQFSSHFDLAGTSPTSTLSDPVIAYNHRHSVYQHHTPIQPLLTDDQVEGMLRRLAKDDEGIADWLAAEDRRAQEHEPSLIPRAAESRTPSQTKPLLKSALRSTRSSFDDTSLNSSPSNKDTRATTMYNTSHPRVLVEPSPLATVSPSKAPPSRRSRTTLAASTSTRSPTISTITQQFSRATDGFARTDNELESTSSRSVDASTPHAQHGHVHSCAVSATAEYPDDWSFIGFWPTDEPLAPHDEPPPSFQVRITPSTSHNSSPAPSTLIEPSPAFHPRSLPPKFPPLRRHRSLSPSRRSTSSFSTAKLPDPNFRSPTKSVQAPPSTVLDESVSRAIVDCPQLAEAQYHEVAAQTKPIMPNGVLTTTTDPQTTTIPHVQRNDVEMRALGVHDAPPASVDHVSQTTFTTPSCIVEEPSPPYDPDEDSSVTSTISAIKSMIDARREDPPAPTSCLETLCPPLSDVPPPSYSSVAADIVTKCSPRKRKRPWNEPHYPSLSARIALSAIPTPLLDDSLNSPSTNSHAVEPDPDISSSASSRSSGVRESKPRVGGYIVLAKIVKANVYEVKHWFPLAGTNLVDIEEEDGTFLRHPHHFTP
ncbi:hypothetical protein BD410DRAFT_847016 [Rickenella mellea]|uniref:Uncharacterized protein n=1 Tax=Rickenella mellea TaxID=50990 RepID=A0A4Y7PDN4_9AGAM|nr:hypothetical protein BD410DRAFT_847016 [Rickenella mellea]